ncbi:MAG: cytochrome c553 [Granulosicoccus sp.]|jgi:cytochrome c553
MTHSSEGGKNVMARWVTSASTLRVLVLVVAAIGASSANAGDAAEGEKKAATCAACHGADGVSQIPTNPILAGQYPSYLERALKDYRSGSRQSAIMAGFASQLSDQDIEDLAAWFSSQKGPLQTTPRK